MPALAITEGPISVSSDDLGHFDDNTFLVITVKPSLECSTSLRHLWLRPVNMYCMMLVDAVRKKLTLQWTQ